MNRLYLIFGLFSGLASLVLQYLYYNGNFALDKGGIVTILILVLLTICVVFSAVAYKKQVGQVSFMRIVFGGFLLALISTIPSVIWYNTTYAINPEFFDPVKEYRLENWKKIKAEEDEAKRAKGLKVEKMTKKQIADTEDQIQKGSQPGYFTIVFLIMNIVVGLVVAAFTAAFIAKNHDYT